MRLDNAWGKCTLWLVSLCLVFEYPRRCQYGEREDWNPQFKCQHPYSKRWQGVLINLTFMKFLALFKIGAWEEIYTDCGILHTGRTRTEVQPLASTSLFMCSQFYNVVQFTSLRKKLQTKKQSRSRKINKAQNWLLISCCEKNES